MKSKRNIRQPEPASIVVTRRGRALIKKDGKILLCQRIGTDYWYLPGGKSNPDETISRALTREIEEELGRKCRAGELVGVCEHLFWDKRRKTAVNEINLVFAVDFSKQLPDKVVSKEKHLRFKWVHLDDCRMGSFNLLPPGLNLHLSAYRPVRTAFYFVATTDRNSRNHNTYFCAPQKRLEPESKSR